MKKGFYTIMSAQFFSSLADNALFVAAIELMRNAGTAEWQRAALVPIFALFYVVLAPFVGAFADAVPKGKVMFYSNGVKVLGCLMMLFGNSPLLSYAIVGLGAAAYSPAKYGILTELLPPSQLVKANGWIEGLTILSIILGVLLGGQLIGPSIAPSLLALQIPNVNLGVDTPAEAAIAFLVVLYVIAALFNLRIPRTDALLQPLTGGVGELVRDFGQCNSKLWRDKLGQISLATTTLFWGVSNNLRYVVLAWAALILGFSTSEASALVGVVAVGTVVGAFFATVSTQLDRATRVIPLFILIGLLVVGMNAIDTVSVAAPFLVLLGAIGGYIVVPMNALLQHRGHNLMGAGRSIAVQNFNEQACVLGMGGLYAGLTRFGLPVLGAMTVFGLFTAFVSLLILAWHRRNQRRHGAELEALFQVARRDKH